MSARALLIGILWLMPSLGTAGALPDPTRPADAPVLRAVGAAPRGPVLQSTLVSSMRRTAVIDGRTVGIGDRVQGATVIDIQPYEVRIRQNGREASLRLLPRLGKEKGDVQ